MKPVFKLALGLSALAAGVAALVWALNVRDEVDVTAVMAAAAPSDSLIARGAYLARAGNCMPCHTAQGGEPYAGGRAIDTPFGTVFSSNLTPDDNTGIGNWSSTHFWRALHNGRSKSGRLLYPAFPYPNYTQITREDSDALFAYLSRLPAVVRPNLRHALRFPYQTQTALALWRALYFSPGVYQPDASHSTEWNRGAYLVKGPGHCSACHTARNALGASSQALDLDLAGGLIPMQNWYAPSLASPHEAGVSQWDREQIVSLLKDGVSPRASATGPMAQVVLQSTQYLNREDLNAMAQFLKELPKARQGSSDAATPPAAPVEPVPSPTSARSTKLYEQHCAQCHGKEGQGVGGQGAPNAYPALAGNRAVTMEHTVNLVQMVLNGGFPPATQGNPRPFGMPPFALVLDDNDIAALLTHVRGSWGNQASAVTPLEVNRIRAKRAPARR